MAKGKRLQRMARSTEQTGCETSHKPDKDSPVTTHEKSKRSVQKVPKRPKSWAQSVDPSSKGKEKTRGGTVIAVESYNYSWIVSRACRCLTGTPTAREDVARSCRRTLRARCLHVRCFSYKVSLTFFTIAHKIARL
eukprot:g82588.t1